jgi:type I restriction enzyme R subunit
MPPKVTYPLPPEPRDSVLNEAGIEDLFIQKLRDLKYTDRPDITDRASLEANFREKFEALNRVRLTDSEFARLLEEIVTPDVFTAAKTLRQINAFTRDDGTTLNYTLVSGKTLTSFKAATLLIPRDSLLSKMFKGTFSVDELNSVHVSTP